MKQDKQRYRVLAVCCLAFLVYHGTRQALPPSLPLLRQQFHLSYFMVSILSTSYEIGYVATLILGGYLSDRFPPKAIVLSSLLGLAGALIFTSYASSFEQLLVGRLLGGLAFGIYFPTALRVIALSFSREQRGTALAIYLGFGAGTGKMLIPLAAAAVLPAMGWPPLFRLVAIMAAIAAISFGIGIPPKGKAQENTEAIPDIRRKAIIEIIADRRLIVLGFVGALAMGSLGVMYSFLPLHLSSAVGFNTTVIPLSIALFNGMGIPGYVLLGILSDRFGRWPITNISLLAAVISLVSLPWLSTHGYPLLAVALAGFSVGTVFPLLMTRALDIVPQEYSGLTSGYVNTIVLLGANALVIASGTISELFGLTAVFPFAALLSGMGLLLVLSQRGR